MTTLPSAPSYFGLEAIAQRLGVSRNTVLAWHDAGRLLMYRRRIGPRWVWYSSEPLILVSEIARARAEREARLVRRAQRHGSR